MINHNHLTPELYDIYTRQYLLNRLSIYFAYGYNDPELLYLGARYALSLGQVHQAKRFLNPLRDLFKEGESFGHAYFPAGLLSVCAQMKADSSPVVYNWLKKMDSSFPPLESLTLEDIATDTKAINEIYYRYTGSDQPESEAENTATVESMNQQLKESNLNAALIAKNNKVSSLGKSFLFHKLGALGSIAYDADQLSIARQALELILTIDGDRPEILRNLITITAELEDIEAYERYWTRYVNILLWRICRYDAPHIAWQDLFLFYSKVASVTDRECSKTIEKTAKILSRPGFIHRWLEAHTALIWLNSTANGLISRPTGTDTSYNSGSNAFRHPIMAKWFDTFYPLFSNILSVSIVNHNLTVSLGPETMEMTFLPFSPEVRIIQRLLQWSECQFGLSDNTTEKQHQTITALVEFSALIPTWYYSKNTEILSWASEKQRTGSLHQEVTEICSMFLNRNLGDFFEKQDWSGLIENFAPECFHHLSSSTILFVALAYIRIENPQPEKAMDTACRSLSNMTPKDLGKDSQVLILWQQIMFAYLNNPDIKNIAPSTKNGKNEYLKQLSEYSEKIKSKITKENIPSDIKSLNKILITICQASLSIKTEEFQQAKTKIASLPEKPEAVADFKVAFLSDIEQAEQAVLLNDMIDEAIEFSKVHIQKGNFNKAREKIKAMPDEPEQLREFKQNFLKQIDEAEENYVDPDLINATIESLQDDVQKGRFNDARRKIRSLPDKAAQLRELKQNFLKQIDEAEKNHNKVTADSDALLKRITDRGVGVDVIEKIAKENNVDVSNPYQFYELLKAIERQL